MSKLIRQKTATWRANYLLIWALRIPPIIATLSASFIIQSIDISYGRGLQIKPPSGYADFTNLQFFGIPILAIATALFTIGAGVVLHRMVYGRSVLAIGQNTRAAWLAGIAVGRIRALTYVLSGTLGGLNGALLAGYFRGANVDIGNEYLLASIAVVEIWKRACTDASTGKVSAQCCATKGAACDRDCHEGGYDHRTAYCAMDCWATASVCRGDPPGKFPGTPM